MSNPLDRFREALRRYPPFAQFSAAVAQHPALVLRGAPGALKALAVADLVGAGRRVVWISPRSGSREEALSDLTHLLPDDQLGLLLTSHDKGDVTPFESRIFRARALQGWISKQPFVLVADPTSIWQDVFPRPEALERIRIPMQTGMLLGRDPLTRRLASAGYQRSELAENRGEFAVRGGILDIFPYTHDRPLRLEFNGDVLESLRSFDSSTQRTIQQIHSETLFLANIEGESGANIAAYAEPDDVLLIEEAEEIGQRAQEAGAADRWDDLLRTKRIIYWGSPQHDLPRHDLSGMVQDDFGGMIHRLADSLSEQSEKHSPCFIACDNTGQMERLRELLEARELREHPVMLVAHFSGGFLLPPGAPCLYTDHQIFRRQRRRRTYFRMHNFSPIERADMLKRGDFVVHEDYGIGRFLGLTTIEVNGHARECLQIEYRDRVNLYVRLESLAKIQKFSGREGFIPPLTRIGRGEWEKLRKKTRDAVKQLASDLLNLYALRSAQEGFSFPEDGSPLHEVEAQFEYEETPDQLKAIEEVKRDMEEPRPMDRLVCGDVGYGKTEVALRAALKAVLGGKQVALLVPTTLLAQQHYNTFTGRLSSTAVEIEMLSRFRTQRQQADILKRLKAGKIDIIIATHRLLSKDVAFNHLGLLIVDEEHRFGVRHKELLKKMRCAVDSLVLTATPIPRTLHMSLIGARDMSLIRTPPQHRLPIETEIAPFSADLIKEAILREIDRGGQVYFVHNRIESIYAVKKMLERWLPQTRLAVAHGQMPESQLEKTMSEFLMRKFDVLISTMIIESGLDLPNVNTMIVNRADRFGLAQLYQLRGRIGRSSRQAYAYLLTPPKTVIADQARKRLQAIRDCSYLGAGFQLALHDLEIRGAGEIFGAKQSGFIHAVGFDLYQKMLEETVQELSSRRDESQPRAEAASEAEPKIDFPLDAYLPPSYVEHPEQRLELYRRLSTAADEETLAKVTEEISDRYGGPPAEAQHLFHYLALKIGCQKAGLSRLELREDYLLAEILLGDHSDWRERLQEVVRRLDGFPAEFSGEIPPTFLLRWDSESDWPQRISIARDLLARLIRLSPLAEKRT